MREISRPAETAERVSANELLRRAQRREGIYEGDRVPEARETQRSAFLRAVDDLLRSMTPGHQNWNAFEQSLSSRAMYDAFVNDSSLSASFSEWPRTVAAISSKIQNLVRGQGLEAAKRVVRGYKSSQDFLR